MKYSDILRRDLRQLLNRIAVKTEDRLKQESLVID